MKYAITFNNNFTGSPIENVSQVCIEGDFIVFYDEEEIVLRVEDATQICRVVRV